MTTQTMTRKTINLIQEIATPHNNVLVEQFLDRQDIHLKLWYAKSAKPERYQWSRDITNQHMSSTIYGSSFNMAFLSYCLKHKDESYVIVGYMNINTKILHILFFILRRPFNHWTDRPDTYGNESMSFKHKILRWLAHQCLLRHSNCRILGVGKTALDYFRNLGFPEHKLVNLPIFVSVDDDINQYHSNRAALYAKYAIPSDSFLIVAGSRLIFKKGYDVLIQAVANLPSGLRKKTKLILVGSGDKLKALQQQIASLGMYDTVRIEDWLDIEDFKNLIANSDIFLHPARFDSYGGTILGMAMGVAVIGSTGAGAAVDRIISGVNGLLYEPEDAVALTACITKLLNDAVLRENLAAAGRETALKWHPRRGVDILVHQTI